MSKFCVRENNQIIRARFVCRAIPILHKTTARVKRTIRKILVKETFRVTHNIRHPVTFRLVIKSFDEFHALPFLAEIIAVLTVIFTIAAEEKQPIVTNRNASIAVKHSPYFAVIPKKQNC